MPDFNAGNVLSSDADLCLANELKHWVDSLF